MPRSLPGRCSPDCIREFRAAARQRFDDATTAAAANRRTAAIYLWGYAAEMILKAAYFALLGFQETRVISRTDLLGAVTLGRGLGISWPPPGLHNVRAWAELIVRCRAASVGLTYPSPSFGRDVIRRGQRLERVWTETLRYHKNVAYLFEVRQVRDAVEWLLLHSLAL